MLCGVDLVRGKFDVAHAAVDNVVSTIKDGGTDIIIVMGGEGSTNKLIAQGGRESAKEDRG